ncbi:PriCT-2 domain-containing protein [Paraburkholderia aspalathi]|uniref:PriCT-2 domain-containing protein n=1 Tax=Paraburkholderia aspalathi TaxID=1324617 RepID=UPI00190A7499|nr:PriCT-2 domain-containing protein [Paraburkholderia aspalathi]MBK3823964.1 hypothetical protein [Paraburkholderia aspalathi]MBK3835805.1 hypothetical protein [Paraburkholderia aspalathi]MBK3865592.1 hypothetical protein [Paraburkholderia aspalathi]
MSEIDRARSALFHLDAGCDRETWVRIGMAARSAGLDIGEWIDWCSTRANYSGEREARTVWQSFRSDGGIGAATLFRLALDAGWRVSSKIRSEINALPVNKIVQSSERLVRATLDPRWLTYWNSLGQIRDSGREYLESRQCMLPPVDGDLRFDPAGRHPSDYTGPCLVALVTDILTGVPISLHRTWVNSDGNKADVDPSRLLLGGHRKAGGAIRLWPDEAVTHGLAIAEGIETALSLARVFQPVWALIDAGNLSKFPPLAGVDALTVAVDDDAAGAKAADTCAERWAVVDRDISLVEAIHGA